MEWEKVGTDGRPRKRKRGLIGVLAVVVLVVLLTNMMRCGSGPKKISWPTSGLATQLPAPKNPKGEIHSDTADEFWASLEGLKMEDRNAYIEACKASFEIDPVVTDSTFKGFNEDGYKLDMSFFREDEIDIEVYAPIEVGDISWPTAGPATQVSAPSKLKGKIETDREDCFAAYLGSMDLESFKAYATACREGGFSVDYSMDERAFSADNAAGYSLHLTYEGNNIARIVINAPDESVGTAAQSESEPQATPETQAESTPAPSGNASFRAMVDEYEAFMNQYVDFMVKYQGSDDVVGMAVEYGKMMSQYGDWAEKIDEVDENALSNEDAAYYLDALNRVNQRLLEIA